GRATALPHWKGAGGGLGSRVARRNDDELMAMKLPDPALLLVTDRHQARLPLADIVRAALAAGCRWVSVREKDLSDDHQIALAVALLPVRGRCGPPLTCVGHAVVGQACGGGGRLLPASGDRAAGGVLLGADKLIGVSLLTVAEAEAIGPRAVHYAIAGPAFQTP